MAILFVISIICLYSASILEDSYYVHSLMEKLNQVTKNGGYSSCRMAERKG